MPSTGFESDDDDRIDKNKIITTPPLTPSHDDENSYSSPNSTKDKNRTPSPQNTPPLSSTPDHNDDDDEINNDNYDSNEHNEKKEDKTQSKTPVWTAYLDDSQRTYYYNSVTGESVWEAPVGESFIPVQGEETGTTNTTTDVDTNKTNDNVTQAMTSENSNEVKQIDNNDSHTPVGTPTGTPSGTPLGSPVGSPAAYSDDGGGITPEHDSTMENTNTVDNKETSNVNETWVAYKDDNGAEYYYNTVTQATQWEKPDGMLTEEHRTDGEQNASTSAMDITDNDNNPLHNDESTKRLGDIDPKEELDTTIKNQETEKEEKTKEEVVVEEDPKVKAIREANEFVDTPDAIFEPACNKHVSKIIELQGQSGGSDMMIKLISSYRGHSSICGLLALWLMDLTTATHNNISTTNLNINNQKATQSTMNKDQNVDTSTTIHSNIIDVRNKAATSIRQLSENVINQLAKNNFTKTAGDEILDIVTSSRKIRFLEDMIDSDSWRRLLIDLSATNKDSALLM